MIDWREYWEEFPRRFGEDEFCRQVGRTAHGGKPTPEPELGVVVSQVADRLALEPGDRLLDLCCGNGLLTARLGELCAAVVGVDFSAPMIDVAREHHASDTVRYVEGSVLDITPEVVGAADFDKVTMFESLQYFRPEQLTDMLRGTLSVCAARARIVFSGVLDADRLWNFFDTPERRANYEQQQREGKEIMGHWWDRRDIERAAAELGIRCHVSDQDPTLNTAHYRFDVRLERG